MINLKRRSNTIRDIKMINSIIMITIAVEEAVEVTEEIEVEEEDVVVEAAEAAIMTIITNIKKDKEEMNKVRDRQKNTMAMISKSNL